MSTRRAPRGVNRRQFLLLGGATAGAGALGLSGLGRLARGATGDPAPLPTAERIVHLAGTDGTAHLADGADGSVGAIANVFPDDLAAGLAALPNQAAPPGQNVYVFGFRNVTGMSDQLVKDQKGRTQTSAPILDFTAGETVNVRLTNLGLKLRPDLGDGHTVHWHGFRNAMPRLDGVPETSVSTPIGRTLDYWFKPEDPGTYMYHCHFEDVEHVQMGMTGVVFVRPAGNPRWAYDDAGTAFDREFSFMLMEYYLQAHHNDAHIQETDWSDYEPSAWLLNGRCYPDTVAPNGRIVTTGGRPPSSSPLHHDWTTDLATASGYEHLLYQPISSRVEAVPGERVLLRFANLGYQTRTMVLDGIPMRIVGRDATQLKGRGGTDLSYLTDSFTIGPGESVDAIFTAPNAPGAKYLLYARDYGDATNRTSGGPGGQTTEVVISASLPPQTWSQQPNGTPRPNGLSDDQTLQV